ncbi:MAG: DUF6709 family protein [Chloroflexota bacterium]
MQTTTYSIEKIVQRSNRILLATSIFCLIFIGVMVAISSGSYWYAQLTGPIEISAEDIIALDGSQRLYNRAVSGEDMEDTFYYEETVNESGRQVSIDAYFGALEIDDDLWVLVRDPDDINRRQEDYVGTFQPITGDIARDVVELSADELNIEYLPVMLDTTGDETMWYVGTAGLLALLTFSIWGVVAYFRRSQDIYKHPIYKSLGRFGEPAEIARQVETDRAMGETKILNATFTERFLVQDTGAYFDVMPYSEIVWMYKMIKKERYGNKSYQGFIYDSTGKEWMIGGKDNEVDDMLQAIGARTPWAAKGYSEDIKRFWDNERTEFVNQVKARYQSLKSQ